mgnify:CR=1 FL=1
MTRSPFANHPIGDLLITAGSSDAVGLWYFTRGTRRSDEHFIEVLEYWTDLAMKEQHTEKPL